MTVWVTIECPHCHNTEVTKYGKSPVGKKRYHCQTSDCHYRTFVLSQTYSGRTREVKRQIVEMTLNGSGVRDIARLLHISHTTVIQEIKKTCTAQASKSKPLAVAKT